MSLPDSTPRVSESVLAKLRAVYSQLSSKEQQVARYILEHASDIVHLSITELSELCECADATVFRLCRRLGFRGFQAFKIALASEVTNPKQVIYQEINLDDEDVLSIAGNIFAANMETLRDTLHILNRDVLSTIIDWLAGAKRIEFYGSGGSAAIAQDAYHKFMRTGIPTLPGDVGFPPAGRGCGGGDFPLRFEQGHFESAARGQGRGSENDRHHQLRKIAVGKTGGLLSVYNFAGNVVPHGSALRPPGPAFPDRPVVRGGLASPGSANDREHPAYTGSHFLKTPLTAGVFFIGNNTGCGAHHEHFLKQIFFSCINKRKKFRYNHLDILKADTHEG